MRVIAKKTIREFWMIHPDCEERLKSRFRKTERSEWGNIQDLKKDYLSASKLKGSRIVFIIKGNAYRLIVKFNFDYQICRIRFIGTHFEYDKIDANTI